MVLIATKFIKGCYQVYYGVRFMKTSSIWYLKLDVYFGKFTGKRAISAISKKLSQPTYAL